MKISIITATKNNKAGLMLAIESVRSQTYKNVEHIIVDGLSTDGTGELLRTEIRNQKPDLCSLISVSETDNGIYDAINKGIKLATGDVIGLLHSDDFFKDEFVLERYAEAFGQSAGRPDKSGFPLRSNTAHSRNEMSSRTNVRDLKATDRFLTPTGIRNDTQLPTNNNPQANIDAVYSDLVYVSQKSKVKSQKMKN